MKKPNETRTRILDIAQSAVLSKGFGATSIEEIVAAAEITKGGFFYHFPDKNALALALIERYIEVEDALFDDLEQKARLLTDDPLQTYLVGLKLLEQLLEDMPNGHPGCLIATAAYQERLFDKNVREANKKAMLKWRKRFRLMLEEIAELYPMRDDVSLDDLSDMLSSAVEGGIVLAKSMGEPNAVAKQVRLYRSYVKLLFQQPIQ
jgi:TetR/AcrR family transcriptional repressor of nem operon